ncbi:GDP-mannose 4,6-dehydratase, partial [Acinetobacter baumannii]
MQQITGRSLALVKGDIRNRDQLESVLREFKCDAVIHFAGLKAVGESVEKPLMYYDNNVVGTVRLLEAMEATGVKTIV